MKKVYSSRHLTWPVVIKTIQNFEKLGLSDKQIIKILKSLGRKGE
jgi:hypothetical protein